MNIEYKIYVPSTAKQMVPPKGVYFPHFEAILYFAVVNLPAHIIIIGVMLLWASKFATAKIECSFEMGK